MALYHCSAVVVTFASIAVKTACIIGLSADVASTSTHSCCNCWY